MIDWGGGRVILSVRSRMVYVEYERGSDGVRSPCSRLVQLIKNAHRRADIQFQFCTVFLELCAALQHSSTDLVVR